MNTYSKPAAAVAISIALGSLVVLGCGDSTKSPKSSGQDKVYDVKGKVTGVDAAKKKVKLDHEDIPGFMKAMEMEFNVEDAKALEGLKSGDQVHGKLKVKPGGDYVISELHKE